VSANIGWRWQDRRQSNFHFIKVLFPSIQLLYEEKSFSLMLHALSNNSLHEFNLYFSQGSIIFINRTAT